MPAPLNTRERQMTKSSALVDCGSGKNPPKRDFQIRDLSAARAPKSAASCVYIPAMRAAAIANSRIAAKTGIHAPRPTTKKSMRESSSRLLMCIHATKRITTPALTRRMVVENGARKSSWGKRESIGTVYRILYMVYGMEVAVLLHNVRSMHNVGSIFRTADAAGVSRIYLTGYTPTTTDRLGRARNDIAKTALGAERYIPCGHHA